MTEFEGVHAALADALTERGYDTLTPVQQAMLDPGLAGADALVSAQTGSGKTVAFGLALAPGILNHAGRFDYAAAPVALVIAPTRELALQVRREIEWLFARTGAIVASCVGGMDYRTEKRTLERGAHIVIGTPGRLRDHIDRGSLDMTSLKAVVLDEADEMLDLGFREDLEHILGQAPEDRRTLMFSATVSKPIAALAKSYQRDAVRVTVQAEARQHVDIDYRAITVSQGDRDHAILNMLRFHEAPTALVFCATRAGVTHLTARLGNRGFSVVALSGELSQTERSQALQAMRDGRARVCIATDVAARGIDLPGLELVIHADLPQNKEALLHRSGRTGRAGRKGISALIVTPRERGKAERLLGWAGVSATWESAPDADAILARDDERLLTDPALTEDVTPDEAALVAALLQTHGPDRVTAALVRLSRAGRSAPEELSAAPEAGRDRNREAFADSVWFELSAGRNQNAEARWLLPMICRRGDITRRDIGAIRLQADQSFVQILTASADTFEKALGPERMLEQGITARRLDSAPEAVIASLDRPEARSERPAPGGKAHFRERVPHRKGPAKPRDVAYGNERLTDKEPRRVSAKPAHAASSAPATGQAPRAAGSGAGKTLGDRAEPRPAARPDWSPTEKGGAKGSDKPAGKYSDKPGTNRGGKPFERSEGKLGGKPGGKPAGKPGAKPFGKPGGKPGGKAGGKPGAKASGKPRPGGGAFPKRRSGD